VKQIGIVRVGVDIKEGSGGYIGIKRKSLNSVGKEELLQHYQKGEFHQEAGSESEEVQTKG